MTEILPGLLYLGNVYTAKDKRFLESKNIEYVLNCAVEVDVNVGERKYLKLNFDDFNTNKNFYKEIDKGMEFINEGVLNNKPILIHCFAGINRSATTTIWYLSNYCKMGIENAHLYVKLKRWIINPILLKNVLYIED